jgi:hypothetical protein
VQLAVMTGSARVMVRHCAHTNGFDTKKANRTIFGPVSLDISPI